MWDIKVLLTGLVLLNISISTGIQINAMIEKKIIIVIAKLTLHINVYLRYNFMRPKKLLLLTILNSFTSDFCRITSSTFLPPCF